MKFIIHDIENFPFVEFKQDQAVPGYSHLNGSWKCRNSWK